MKPIRILQVLTIMNRGGAETMIMNYYRAIDKTKVQFDFLLHRAENGAFDDEIKELGGNIYRMAPISPKNYFSYKKSLKLFFEEHPEYKIVHSHLNALSSIILGIAKEKNIAIRIAHSHLAVQPYLLKKIFYKNTDILAVVKDSVQTLIRKRVRKNATHFFSCSIKAGNWLFGKNNASKVIVINNAIDTSKFVYSEAERRRIRASLNLTNEKVIGHIGRFSEQKNHFFLIKVFKQVVLLDDNVVLLLVGEGDLKEKIQVEVNKLGLTNKVKFLGLRDDVPKLLQAIDLALMPSLYEGLPVACVEFQGSDLPVIAADTITNELNFTNRITFLNLGLSPAKWAAIILNSFNEKRKDTSSIIINNGYDIHANAFKLQKFYIDVWN